MHKTKINYRMLNVLILVAIVCLVYLIKDLWLGVVIKLLDIFFPFIIAFALAYAVSPIVLKLRSLGLPKCLALLVVSFLIIGFIITIIILIVPMLYDQILLFLSNISVFISDISSKYKLNLGILQTYISDISLNVIKNIGDNLSNGALTIVNSSINVITSIIIILFSSIYFLIDMEKIRKFIKFKLGRKKKRYNYIKYLDEQLSNYCVGLGQNILIQLAEYTFIFFLIGHPNYLVLGILAAFTNIIPYFGALLVDILALLIASVISDKLFILTLIVVLICPLIDGYIISPRIYGKTNSIHPLVSIFAVFAGGILGGFWGIVLSLPIAILIISTFKFFLPDINTKIDRIKRK